MHHSRTGKFARIVVVSMVVQCGLASGVPGDAPRAKWDTAPGTYTITMPDYHHASRTEWRDQRSEVWMRLSWIVDEALQNVADPRLTIEQRTDALSIVELFPPMLTAEKLIEVIDLKDDRGVFFGEIARGPYPVVTVLKKYGAPVTDYAEYALVNESDSTRRQLLCDVLEQAIGLNQAQHDLDVYTEKDSWTNSQLENLAAARQELRSRWTERPNLN